MKPCIPLLEKLFNKNYNLIDGTDEIFELDLALWEYKTLSKKELINRSAYFKSVDSIETIHYKLCNLQNLEEVYKESSFRAKSFFLNGKYSTGYATHGLFPYRGKFHPQLIRALLNILGVKQGELVLDPMAGSATVSVEANLLGINSISVDISPLCELIGKVKTFALNLDIKILEKITNNQSILLTKLKKDNIPQYFISSKDNKKKRYYEIILLAYLDAVGFSKRKASPVEQLFYQVLRRYVTTIKYFQAAKEKIALKIGNSKIIQGNALDLPIDDDSIDAIITSPPYSFAIDYLKNDLEQLKYLGASIPKLRQMMIGLQGKCVDDKLAIYFDKMEQVIREMKRVTKNNAPIVMIVGTNNIQTKGVNLEKEILKIAKRQGLEFELNLKKPIKGLQNTMKEESILFFTNKK
ncbi:MAG: hypothetical protein LBR30_06785 [Clostridioides sp.]|jgi:DNA modification methylase|nr:hypothetical protein [Clostridioides sp.]